MLTTGIVGLPNVGKSALFNTLTGQGVPSQNFPFCTIDPSVGIVPVKDHRLEKLAALSSSKKVIPATVSFKDIAGLIKGASEGQGLGNDFLSHIREVDAIVHLIRIFDDSSVIHVNNAVDPLKDKEVIEQELILADLQMIEKHRARLEKLCRQGDSSARKEDAALAQAQKHLETETPLRLGVSDDETRSIYQRAGLLTEKPIVFCLNGNIEGNIEAEKLLKTLQNDKETAVSIDARNQHATDSLISACYEALNRISFFTTGPEETRAWTIRKGALAPEAGAAIHTDFKDKFIRAEIVGYEDFIDAGSLTAARSKGVARVEGKQYMVQDGDIILFRI